MKWKTKPKPEYGDFKVERKFAWSNVKCDDGFTVYLGYYWVISVYKKVERTFLPYIGEFLYASDGLDLGGAWRVSEKSSSPIPETSVDINSLQKH